MPHLNVRLTGGNNACLGYPLRWSKARENEGEGIALVHGFTLDSV